MTILKVEQSHKLGTILHVRADRTAGPIVHMPFLRWFLKDSVLEPIGFGGQITDLGGYKVWRQGFEAGRAGVFAVPVSEGIELILDTWKPAKP